MEQVTEALQTAHSPSAPEPLRAQALQVRPSVVLAWAGSGPSPFHLG